jgi:hypothetical protein
MEKNNDDLLMKLVESLIKTTSIAVESKVILENIKEEISNLSSEHDVIEIRKQLDELKGNLKELQSNKINAEDVIRILNIAESLLEKINSSQLSNLNLSNMLNEHSNKSIIVNEKIVENGSSILKQLENMRELSNEINKNSEKINKSYNETMSWVKVKLPLITGLISFVLWFISFSATLVWMQSKFQSVIENLINK